MERHPIGWSKYDRKLELKLKKKMKLNKINHRGKSAYAGQKIINRNIIKINLKIQFIINLI